MYHHTSVKVLLAFSVIVHYNLFAINGHYDDIDAKDVVDVTILHTNDLHGRFAQIDAEQNECGADDAVANRCFGGFPRLVHT